jgi:hypothetical protein
MRKKTQKMAESTEVTAVVADEQSNKKRLKARECGKARNCLWDVGNVKYSNRDEKEKALSRNLTVQLLMIRIRISFK